ncbi:lanthionine synthetase LanC family protein [Shouchella lonarensis]|uniref:Protein kinase domain-containing protein n=1 Tax=Shouchella lonarensis TaxID=1464122 RepID=A0A1G6MGN9_9BACI|nr:lanthionine synthetase LanC family protein [Shouchella lonarensis]SDC54689.1 Protein kinase domain-containing protein [Shouchella lonarensis]
MATSQLHYTYLLHSLSEKVVDPMKIVRDKKWLYFSNHTYELPQQGWKIHLSIILPQVQSFLQEVAPFLLNERVDWKIPSNEQGVVKLLLGEGDRVQVGKFLTIYPRSEAVFEQLLEKLYERTSHFFGPEIVTDMRYKDSQCLFYRYGAFAHMRFYDRYSQLRKAGLRDEHGEMKEDRRVPFVTIPDWVELPPALQLHEKERESSLSQQSNPFAKRGLVVRAVLKKGAKGSVFVVDTSSHKEVVLKEARAHMMTGLDGRDARARLKHEYDLLVQCRGLDVTPQVYEYFQYGDHAYMVMEKLPGVTLRKFTEDLFQKPLKETSIQMMQQVRDHLHQSVATLHKHKVILRDLTPNNVMVLPDFTVRFIDLELACNQSSAEPLFDGLTPGYALPDEQVLSHINMTARDRYALGAIDVYLALGTDPFFGVIPFTETIKKVRSLARCIEEKTFKHLCESGLSVMEEVVAEQKEREKLSNYVRMEGASFCTSIYEKMDFKRIDQLLPDNSLSDQWHVATFNHGLAGVMHFFHEMGQVTEDEMLFQYSLHVYTWLERHHPFVKGVSPVGLYFGYGAVPWVLADASHYANNAELQTKAVELALTIADEPCYTANVSHGLAGLGLMLLHVYHITKDERLLQRARARADQILSSAEEMNGGIAWPTPISAEKRQYFLGYSHGIAGIGTFLVALFKETNEKKYKECVERIVDTLDRTAIKTETSAVVWPKTFSLRDTSLQTSWCNGAAGIGQFLLSVLSIDDQEETRALAVGAVNAVLQSNVVQVNNQCHGMAGEGDFLIAAKRAVVGDQVAIDRKLRLIEKRLLAVADIVDGQYCWTGEDKMSHVIDYMTGYLGIYSFLARLQMGLTLPLSNDSTEGGLLFYDEGERTKTVATNSR